MLPRRGLRRVVLGIALVAAACTDTDGPVATVGDGRFRNPWGEECARPCLFGAVVGESTLDSAEAQLRARPELEGVIPDRFEREIRFHGSDPSVWVRADDEGLVETIWVGVDEGRVTYRDVLATMGEPSAVHLFLRPGMTSSGYVSWFYRGIVLTSWLDAPSLGPDDSVDNMDIRRPEQDKPIFPVALNAVPFIEYRVPAWLGFGAVERYLADERCAVTDVSPLFPGASCPQ